MKLLDMAATWIKSQSPSADLQRDFLHQIELAQRRGVACSFAVGRKLLRRKKPCLVYCLGGEFFSFELTPRQVQRMGMQDHEMTCTIGTRRETHLATGDPIALLDKVTVDNASSLQRARRITGTLRYNASRDMPSPAAIKVVCEPPNCPSITLFHHLCDAIPRADCVAFSLDDLGTLRHNKGKPFSGVVPLFFQIWTSRALQPPPGFGGASQPAPPSVPAPPPGNSVFVSPFIDSAANAGAIPAPPFKLVSAGSPNVPRDRPLSDIRAVLVNIRS